MTGIEIECFRDGREQGHADKEPEILRLRARIAELEAAVEVGKETMAKLVAAEKRIAELEVSSWANQTEITFSRAKIAELDAENERLRTVIVKDGKEINRLSAMARG